MGCEINLACFPQQSPNSNILSMTISWRGWWGIRRNVTGNLTRKSIQCLLCKKKIAFYKVELVALWIIAFLIIPVIKLLLAGLFLCIVITFGWWSASTPAGRKTSRVPYLVCREVWIKEFASYLDREVLRGAPLMATNTILSKVHRAAEKNMP